jgi:hypothetical protein
LIAFVLCFGLARVIAAYWTDWPPAERPNAAQEKEVRSELHRPVSLNELAALGIGSAALLVIGWIVRGGNRF